MSQSYGHKEGMGRDDLTVFSVKTVQHTYTCWTGFTRSLIDTSSFVGSQLNGIMMYLYELVVLPQAKNYEVQIILGCDDHDMHVQGTLQVFILMYFVFH